MQEALFIWGEEKSLQRKKSTGVTAFARKKVKKRDGCRQEAEGASACACVGCQPSHIGCLRLNPPCSVCRFLIHWSISDAPVRSQWVLVSLGRVAGHFFIEKKCWVGSWVQGRCECGVKARECALKTPPVTTPRSELPYASFPAPHRANASEFAPCTPPLTAVAGAV